MRETVSCTETVILSLLYKCGNRARRDDKSDLRIALVTSRIVATENLYSQRFINQTDLAVGIVTHMCHTRIIASR